MSKRAGDSSPTISVLGAGSGGITMAADLAIRGFRVNLWNRSLARIQPLIASPQVRLTSDHPGLPIGTGTLNRVTTDPAAAVAGSSLLMVVVPATGHASVAREIAPHLTDGQVLVLNPGRTGGALEFQHSLRLAGCSADVIVAEAQTLLYACRSDNPGQAKIFGIKNSVPVAAIPAHKTPQVIRTLSTAFDSFVPGDNVIKTSLDNIGAVFHPAVTVLNCARIESTHGDFEFYIDGITPSVARTLERVDKERVSVGAAIGFNCMSAREWLYVAYGAAGSTLFDAIRANDGYYGIRAPHSLDTRYLSEDVPASLVPIASLGEEYGAPCPTIRSVIAIAEVITGEAYSQTGRTAESMGIKGLSLLELRRLVLEGAPDRPSHTNNGPRYDDQRVDA